MCWCCVLQVGTFTVESVLSGILYMRVQHYTEQLALIAVLDLLLQQQPKVGVMHGAGSPLPPVGLNLQVQCGLQSTKLG